MARSLVRGTARVHLWGGTYENVIRMEGVIREANVDQWLKPLFEEIHEAAVRLKLRELVLDIRPLEYANAAVWRCLVQWIKQMRQLLQAYRLIIVTDPKRSWQKVGAPALRAFSLDGNGIERLIVQQVDST
jgi:hypothetical protein